MTDCELISGCIFFNDKMSEFPITAERMKRDYCKGDNSACARYRVFKAFGRENVPKNLFPNDTDRADKMLSAIS